MWLTYPFGTRASAGRRGRVDPDRPITVVLDVDGTLVDTNYQHAIAWHRALRSHGHAVQLWEIHRHIGMGGDQIVAALIGEEGERSDGEAIREAEGEAYAEMIGEVQAMHGATELLEELREDGARAILASSAKAEEVERYVELLDAAGLVEGWTTSADVERTKPNPDLVNAALEKVGCEGPAVMVGDSTWDVKAAEAAGVRTMAVLTGGFSDAELREAGAVEVCESIGELRKDRQALARLAAPIAAGSG
jgi:HAD superfamily hydrolase (TIGR01509 family)